MLSDALLVSLLLPRCAASHIECLVAGFARRFCCTCLDFWSTMTSKSLERGISLALEDAYRATKDCGIEFPMLFFHLLYDFSSLFSLLLGIPGDVAFALTPSLVYPIVSCKFSLLAWFRSTTFGNFLEVGLRRQIMFTSHIAQIIFDSTK